MYGECIEDDVHYSRVSIVRLADQQTRRYWFADEALLAALNEDTPMAEEYGGE